MSLFIVNHASRLDESLFHFACSSVSPRLSCRKMQDDWARWKGKCKRKGNRSVYPQRRHIQIKVVEHSWQQTWEFDDQIVSPFLLGLPRILLKFGYCIAYIAATAAMKSTSLLHRNFGRQSASLSPTLNTALCMHSKSDFAALIKERLHCNFTWVCGYKI